MEFGKILREIRANRDAESHFQWILASLKKEPRRRLQVRALLAKSRSDWRRARAAHYAETAGDLLWTILKKPKCAEIVYRYALTIADDPLPSLMPLFEIAEKYNRFELAYELANRIIQVASPLQAQTIQERLQAMAPDAGLSLIAADEGAGFDSDDALVNLQSRFSREGQGEVADELREKCIELLFRGRPDNDEFEKRVISVKSWLASDAVLRESLLAELRSKERFQNVVAVLALCAKSVKDSERKEVLKQLGYTYRFGVGQLDRARECFQDVVDDDPDDREAWGELLELLADLDDHEALSDALRVRIEVSTGLEKRELMRQREDLLKRTGQEAAQ